MIKDKKKIWLSILLPAYNFPAGTKRIYDFIIENYVSGVELIVCDDSENKDIKILTKNHKISRKPWFSYSHNLKSRGAVKNWNYLISKANGDYIWLLHHDELPADNYFLSSLNKIIKKRGSASLPDIIFVKNYLQFFSFNLFISHTPNFLKELIVKFVPKYLFMHNIVGAPSSIIIRRNLIVFFDELLSWFVDVSWYNQLLCRSKSLFFSELAMLSYLDNPNSISKVLSHKVKKIKIFEASYLQHTYEVLKLIKKKSLFYKLVYFLDFFIWKIIYINLFLSRLLFLSTYKVNKI